MFTMDMVYILAVCYLLLELISNIKLDRKCKSKMILHENCSSFNQSQYSSKISKLICGKMDDSSKLENQLLVKRSQYIFKVQKSPSLAI